MMREERNYLIPFLVEISYVKVRETFYASIFNKYLKSKDKYFCKTDGLDKQKVNVCIARSVFHRLRIL